MKPVLIAAGLALLASSAALAQTDAAPAPAAHFTLETPIKDLIADPAAKAVLDKDLPGMSSDENLPKFEDKSLRQMQPLSGGQLTDTLMKQVAGDLMAIGSNGAPAASDARAAADAPVVDDTPDAAPPAADGPPAGSTAIPDGR